MGIYFIAAGIKKSKNREKSLDQGFSVSDLEPFLPHDAYQRLKQHIEEGELVFAWGANRPGNLNQISPGDFVVDVKNRQIVQIFQFTFWLKTRDTKLQEFIGWDSEKPVADRRPYKFVYFLKSPHKTKTSQKSYYQSAFKLDSNMNWLAGQRWFSDIEVQSAIDRVNARSVADFLGISEPKVKISSEDQDPEPSIEDASGSSSKKAGDQAGHTPITTPVAKPPTWILLFVRVAKAVRRLFFRSN